MPPLSRFASWNRDRFPAWIVPNYCTYQKFGEFSKSLAQFFKDKGPKREAQFTSILPKENGFGKNASLRMVSAGGFQKCPLGQGGSFSHHKCRYNNACGGISRVGLTVGITSIRGYPVGMYPFHLNCLVMNLYSQRDPEERRQDELYNPKKPKYGKEYCVSFY